MTNNTVNSLFYDPRHNFQRNVCSIENEIVKRLIKPWY